MNILVTPWPGIAVTCSKTCLLYTSDAADEEDSVDINSEKKDIVTEFLYSLEDDDDVQSVFSNVNLGANWC